MSETNMLHFSVEGGFVTQMGREKLYMDKDMGAAMRIIMSGTETDQLSYDERLMLCLQILNGDAEITGNTADGSYGVEIRDDIDKKPTQLENIVQLITDMKEQMENLEKENHKLEVKFSMACEKLSEFELDDLNAEYYNEYEEPMFSDRAVPSWRKAENQLAYVDTSSLYSGNAMLASYMEQAKRVREKPEEAEEDYGWLSPEGEWFPVEWGRHSEWAMNWLNEHKPFREFHKLYWMVDDNGIRHHISNGDVLIHSLGWVLMDNPWQGLARATKSPKQDYTKAQKEFLYDYYTRRGRTEDANKLYED